MNGDRSYWDGWFADQRSHPAKDALHRRHLGLPPDLAVNNLVPLHGIDEIADELRVGVGDTFLDLACGRGGVGLRIAARTGAGLIGHDISSVAIDIARVRAAEMARTSTLSAAFAVTDMTSTGLEDDAVDAVMCIDAPQFADPVDLGRELARVIRPGGRVVLTGWQAAVTGDPAVPEKLRELDLASLLRDAGFDEVCVREPTSWLEAEHAMWHEAAELNPGDDPALRSFVAEGRRAVERWGSLRRVFATASR